MSHEPRRRRPLLRFFLLGIVLLLLAAGDWYARNLEMDALVDRIQESEDRIISTLALMEQTNEEYDREFRRVDARGLDEEASLIREEWIEEIEINASLGAEALIADGSLIRRTFVLPWHRAIRRAKSDYLDHHREWERELLEIARDGEKSGEKNPRLGGTFEIVEDSLTRAIPPFPQFDLEPRVAYIFED